MNEEPEIVLEEESPVLPPPLPPPPPPPPLPPPRPWNGWITLVWMFAVLGVWFAAQLVFFVFFFASKGMFADPDRMEELASAAAMDGDVLGVATVFAALAACPLCYFIGHWRRGFTGGAYLSILKRPAVLPTIGWSLATIGVGMLFNFLGPFLGVDESPEFMRDVVGSTDFMILLVLGVVVGAPLVEEFIFRGLLFRGWRESKLGLWGTLVVTSVVWTSLHAGQYGLVVLLYLFLLGLLLGYVRERTGNLWIPIVMHAVNNAVATWETVRAAG